MSICTVIMDLHWNERLNGGKMENVVQLIDNTKYYWNCYNCGNVYQADVMSFLESMRKCSTSQFNVKCKNCKIDRGLGDDLLNSYMRSFSNELQELTFYAYRCVPREQDFIAVCPVCGKYHIVKLRSIRRNGSFVCKECMKKYGGSTLEGSRRMVDICPNMEKFWGSNRFSYKDTVALIPRQPYNLICPRCGKRHTKSLEAVKRSGFYCEQCAVHRGRLGNVGSLKDNYPEVADMWDRGCNGIKSSDVLPSSTMRGNFVCTRQGVEHRFESIVYAVVEAAKVGNNGCPICKNRQVGKGYNDFKTLFPDLVKYWDHDKNINLPENSVCTRITKFYLKCPRCGKSHMKRTDAVERNGAYCEKCARVVNMLAYSKSLKEEYPDIAEMWDMGGNTISSSQLTSGSEAIGNFLCTHGKYKKPHIFRKSVVSLVNSRKKGFYGCPVCSGFKVASGVNDFKTICPKGAKLWDYSKNTLKPEDVYYKSEKNFFFICPEGHSFEKDLLHMVRSEGTSASGCPICAGRDVRRGINDLATTMPDTVDKWCYDLNTITPYEVTAGSNKIIKARCRVCGDVYETEVYNWCHNLVVACEKCRKRQFSIAEKELCEEIRSWGLHVEENKRLTGDARTYDMYIPETNIAIEYNGLYYHSDAVRVNSNYHFEKCLDCLQNGIELIQIWEDDYIFKKPIVLSFLKRKLGVSNEEKVNARDCEPMFIDVSDAREFLDLYHIQGFVSGSKYVGLCDKDSNIMAVIVLEKNKKDNSVLIKRYASCCNVRGGFSKLVASIKEVFEDCDSVYTFSDNTISLGDLYKNNGFKSKQFLPPDYKYVVAGRRVHKFNYRKDRFKSDPNLYYEEGLTEEELAEENGLIRVYDAGKIKWYKKL